MSDTATAEPVTQRALPMQMREAQIVPETWNAEARTVDVVWTTGARVRRFDWWNGIEYDEELGLRDGEVDMSRFEAGAVQVLDGHDTTSGIRSILGVVERAWFDDSRTTGRATLRLSQREELAGMVADIAAGIIRCISVGYSVQQYSVTPARERTDDVNRPLYVATRWMPHELSFVPVGADMGATTRQRSQDTTAALCTFVRATPASTPGRDAATTTEVRQMAEETRAATTGETAQATAPGNDAAAALERAAAITELCTQHGCATRAAEFIRAGMTVEAAGLAILRERAEREQPTRNSTGTVRTVSDEFDNRIRGMEQALQARVDPKAKLDDAGRQFRGMSLLELGRDYLESVGVRTRGMDRAALASAILVHRSGQYGNYLQTRSPGYHTTSDFANLMANVATKRLRAGYEEKPATFMQWARRAPNAPDFKNMSVVQLSAMPDLLQVNEAAEFTYAAMSDGAETYGLLTWGRIVGVSRQAIINDDLRAFDRSATGFGASAMRVQNRVVYAQLQANLADGNAVFTTARGNNATGVGSALSLTSLQAARTAMRTFRGLQGELLNIAPSYLVVPAALESLAYQLTSNAFTPAVQSNINDFAQGGRTALTPVVDAVLDATSATAWFAIADSSQVDTIEYCYLDGAEGPVVEMDAGFDTDGISIKCRLDFAAKAIDWRGMYRGVGA